jgi:hypothetical protein
MEDATVPDILEFIAKNADLAMRKLADAIEHRETAVLPNLFANPYLYVTLLKNLNEDFDLPGEWPRIAVELYKELEYLRALSSEIQRRR